MNLLESEFFFLHWLSTFHLHLSFKCAIMAPSVLCHTVHIKFEGDFSFHDSPTQNMKALFMIHRRFYINVRFCPNQIVNVNAPYNFPFIYKIHSYLNDPWNILIGYLTEFSITFLVHLEAVLILVLSFVKRINGYTYRWRPINGSNGLTASQSVFQYLQPPKSLCSK